MDNKRFIGLDIGSKKVGIAISDPTAMLAKGVKSVFAADLISELKKLIILERSNVQALVVGLPVSKSGEAGKKMKRWAVKLEQELKLPVFFEDERLTSWEARERLKEAGYSNEQIQKLEDQTAAQLILQSYLNRLCNEDN